jgi:hypothetical protein
VRFVWGCSLNSALPEIKYRSVWRTQTLVLFSGHKYSKMFFTFPNISQKFFQTLAEVSVCAAVKAEFRSAAVVYTQRLVCGAPFDFNENTILNSGGDGIPTRADVGMSTGAIPIISSTRTVSPGVVEVEDEMEGLAMPDMIVRFYDFYCLV